MKSDSHQGLAGTHANHQFTCAQVMSTLVTIKNGGPDWVGNHEMAQTPGCYQ